MCGRAYSTHTDEQIIFRYMNKKAIWPVLKPNFNITPSQQTLILRMLNERLIFQFFQWGLVPSWSQDPKTAYKMINARAETITEKPAFKDAFKKRRCIVPLSGFIEWKRDRETKRPFSIQMKDRSIMSIAGIWEAWKSPDSQELHSFSIITTEANALMAKIHDRMPVILSPENEKEWLDPGNKDTAQLQKLLKPCSSEWLTTFEISTLINSPKNNRKEVLDPL